MHHHDAARYQGVAGQANVARALGDSNYCGRDVYAQFPEPQYNIEELVRQTLVHDVEPGCLCISTEQKALTAVGHTILSELDTRRNSYYRMRDQIGQLTQELAMLHDMHSKEREQLRSDRDNYRERYYAESRTNAHYRSNVDDLTTILNGPESDRMPVTDAVRQVAVRLASGTTSEAEVGYAAAWLDANTVEEAAEPVIDKGVPADVEQPVPVADK